MINTQCREYVRLREKEDDAIAKLLDIGRSMVQCRAKYDTLMNNCNDGTLLLHFYNLNLQRSKIHKYNGISLSYLYDDDDADVSGIRIVITPPHPIHQK